MTSEEIARLHVTWPKFTLRVLELLESWDSARGVLFISKDDSADEVIPKLAAYLTQTVITYCGEKKAEWQNKVDFLSKKGIHSSLFGPQPGNVCVVVHDLDKKPEWLYGNLKSIFEHHVRPCVILSSAEEDSKIASYLRSHFWLCKKTGRVRSER